MIQLVCDKKDITRYAEQITWSGDIQQCYRSVSVKLRDGIRPECGDKVVLYENGKALFSGYVQEITQDVQSASLEAHDVGMYLMRNNLYREYKGTPQAITRAVCKELGLRIDKIATKKATRKITSTGSKSAWKVIEESYEGTRKRAKQYTARIVGGRLYIERVGVDYVGRVAAEIETISRTWSIKSMVNRVVIINDKNKKKGAVQNKSDRKKYGTYQKTYKQSKGKNAAKEAKELLSRLEKKGTITALGNSAMIAGKRIKVTDKATGMSARQVIKSDKHTWSGGGHEMTLEMYYAET